MTLSEKIAKLRRQHGWSQEELAEKMDVSRQAVSKWEGGLAVPDIDNLVRLSTLMGVTIDDLLKADDVIPHADDHRYDRYDRYDQHDRRDRNDRSDPDVALPPAEPTSPESHVRTVTRDEAECFLSERRRASGIIAVATFLCVLSPIPVLLMSAAAETGRWHISENLAAGLGVIVLFLLVACAVPLFVCCGFRNSPYEFLDRAEPFELTPDAREVVTARQDSEHTAYIRTHLLATFVCILSPIPLLVGVFSEREWLTVVLLCVTMAIAGVGAMLFILSGVRRAATQKLLKEGDYTPRKLRAEGVKEVVGTIYWGLLTAAYLLWSFLSGDWHLTWLTYAVGGVLFPVVMSLVGLLLDRMDNGNSEG